MEIKPLCNQKNGSHACGGVKYDQTVKFNVREAFNFTVVVLNCFIRSADLQAPIDASPRKFVNFLRLFGKFLHH